MKHRGLAKINGMLAIVEFRITATEIIDSSVAYEKRSDGWTYKVDEPGVALLTADLERAVRAEEFERSPLARWQESWG